MLVLNRREGDTFTITAPNGDVITIVVLNYRRVREPVEGSTEPQVSHEMRIGIDAPQDYHILRDDAVDDRPKKGRRWPRNL